MRRLLLSSVVFLSVCIIECDAPAQVNIEKFRRKQMEEGYSGFIELDLTHKTGNVELTELEVEGRLDRRSKRSHSFLIIETGYGWQGGRRFSNEGLVHARHVFGGRPALQPELFIQYNYDRERLLNFRLLAGAGIRSVLYGSDDLQLSLGTTLMPEHEEYDLDASNSHDRKVTVLRWSSYLAKSIRFGESAAWTSTFYVQPDVEDFDDVRLLLDSALSVDILDKLSIVVEFSLLYDSEPPDGIESLDTELEPGLVFRF